jgi:Protein of unknown function (DUF2934)
MDETKPRRAPRKTSSAGAAPKAKAKAPAKAAAPVVTRAPAARKAALAKPPVAAQAAAAPPDAGVAAVAPRPALDPELRARMVETAAYFRAERRGFTPGYEVEDWLAAEAEIESLVGGPASPARSGVGARRKDG